MRYKIFSISSSVSFLVIIPICINIFFVSKVETFNMTDNGTVTFGTLAQTLLRFFLVLMASFQAFSSFFIKFCYTYLHKSNASLDVNSRPDGEV